MLVLSFILIIFLYYNKENYKIYDRNSLCYGFTGLSRYHNIKGLCKIDCEIRTYHQFRNSSNNNCGNSNNDSQLINGILYSYKPLKVYQYLFENDKWIHNEYEMSV